MQSRKGLHMSVPHTAVPPVKLRPSRSSTTARALGEIGCFFKHSGLYALVKNVGAAPLAALSAAPWCTAVHRPAPKSVLWSEGGKKASTLCRTSWCNWLPTECINPHSGRKGFMSPKETITARLSRNRGSNRSGDFTGESEENCFDFRLMSAMGSGC